MAADTEVIRKFLVSLGYTINEIDQRKFDDAINKSSKAGISLGKTLLGAAASAQALVATVAMSMEKLYYLSQRTGTSVSDIKAAEFAGRQIGLNAATIDGVINSMSRSIKANPGVEALISGLTGKPVAGRSMAKVMEEVVGSLAKYPDYYSFQVAGQLGIDPDTYLQLKNNLSDYLGQEERQRQIYKDMGVDLDKSKETLKEYSRTIRDLGEKAEAVGAKIAIALVGPFRELNSILGFALERASILLDHMDQPAPKNMEDVAMAVPDGAWNLGADAGIQIRKWLGWSTEDDAAPGRRKVSGKVIDEPSKTAPAAQGKLPRGQRNNNPGNIEYGAFAKSMGATGSDGRFAIFPDLITGTSAMAALLGRYGSQGLDTIDEIIEKWAPSKENPVTASGGYAGFLAGKMGVGRKQKLDMTNQNTIAQLISGIGLLDSRIDPIKELGGSSGINQSTVINVNGVTDPNATAKAVGREQSQVNADLVRQMKGAVQ